MHGFHAESGSNAGTPRGAETPHLYPAADGQVMALQKQVEALREQLRVSETKVAMWEECMQQLLYCMLLSPDMNDMYKTECVALLREALQSVEQIEKVHYVECSFPSVPAEAPHIQLERWTSLDESEWNVRWAPSWSIQVALEGLQYVQFRLMLRLFDFRVSGRLKLRAKPDFSSIVLSFIEMPKLRLRTGCNVSWGAVPLPLQDYLESFVKQEVRNWLSQNIVSPNQLEINPPNFQPKKGLTEEDVEKAIRAVTLARHYSAVNES